MNRRELISRIGACLGLAPFLKCERPLAGSVLLDGHTRMLAKTLEWHQKKIWFSPHDGNYRLTWVDGSGESKSRISNSIMLKVRACYRRDYGVTLKTSRGFLKLHCLGTGLQTFLMSHDYPKTLTLTALPCGNGWTPWVKGLCAYARENDGAICFDLTNQDRMKKAMAIGAKRYGNLTWDHA